MAPLQFPSLSHPSLLLDRCLLLMVSPSLCPSILRIIRLAIWAASTNLMCVSSMPSGSMAHIMLVGNIHGKGERICVQSQFCSNQRMKVLLTYKSLFALRKKVHKSILESASYPSSHAPSQQRQSINQSMEKDNNIYYRCCGSGILHWYACLVYIYKQQAVSLPTG